MRKDAVVFSGAGEPSLPACIVKPLLNRLVWTLWRRLRLAHAVEGYYAHPWTYADTRCTFAPFCQLHRSAVLFDTHLGLASYTSARMIRVRAGKFCSIGFAVVGGQGRHPTHLLSTHPAFYSSRQQAGLVLTDRHLYDEEPRPVAVGSDVWIGDGAVVMEGCSIGDGAIIAASAVVVDDVPPYAIVGGVPARLIRYRFNDEVIEALRQWKWWDLPITTLKSLAPRLSSNGPLTLESVKKLREHEG